MARKFKGRDIVNPSRGMRLRVTEADIKKGTPLDPENCAVAECIKRITGADEVSVHRGVVMIVKGNKAHRLMTSSGVRLETIVFDRGGVFIPGEYDLKPVPAHIIAPKKKSKSAPRTGMAAKLSRRRTIIPGVRRRLYEIKKEEDK